ncbi:MAG: hypothetical protein VB085_08740 [Peptococcaceae bacterium]|nr:hypothetical protein [Peptococcaceae bacterium]
MEMQAFLQEAVSQIVIALAGLCLAFAAYGIKRGTDWLRQKTAALKSEEQRRELTAALEDLDMLTDKTVTAIEQTTASEIRKLIKDGKASREELVALSKDAYTRIRSSLAPEYQAVLQENFGNLKDVILAGIEAKVLELKRAAPATEGQ